ncbi:winged helix-turn-helix transcriptional regulator [Erythrobacter sp. Alg231-14]|uniref:winged helix-turn-helix transcriptional regulator n=1 Tax=Erythrobacter sp. Alg231-14 TaxID=1922225 RepID=UPI000D559AA3
MKWNEVSSEQCSVARVSAVLGDRWTLVILSECFLGVRRFEHFKERLDIPRTTLSTRLQRLEDHGVLERRLYQEGPDRHEYRLTPKGVALYPVLSTIVTWGDTYYSDEAGPPILRKHVECGHDIQPVLACPECRNDITPRQMSARKRPDGPGQQPVRRGPITG